MAKSLIHALESSGVMSTRFFHRATVRFTYSLDEMKPEEKGKHTVTQTLLDCFQDENTPAMKMIREEWFKIYKPKFLKEITDRLLESRELYIENRSLKEQLGKIRDDEIRLLRSLKGIGPVKAEKLMDHFGTLREVALATREELQEVIGEMAGHKLYNQIGNNEKIRY